MVQQYVATTDPNWKEKYAFSPYDPKHIELLNEFIHIEIVETTDPAISPVLAAVEERFKNEHILIFPAHRVMIFDAVYDYLKANKLWQELFVLPEPTEEPEPIAAEDLPDAA